MKQWSRWFAAGLLAAVLTVSVSAAPENVEQSARGCMEAEQSTSHTPRAVRRLLEYLSKLPEEQAILILGDAELLNNMMMDYYWEPYEEENPLAGFAQRKGIALEEQGEGAYILTGLTVDELSVKLRHQVIKTTAMTGCISTSPTRTATKSCSGTARAVKSGRRLKKSKFGVFTSPYSSDLSDKKF